MDAHRLFQTGEKVVNKDREAGDVVHVWMGHDDVAHLLTLRVAQGDGHAARIDGHAVVNQVASEALITGSLAVAIKAAG